MSRGLLAMAATLVLAGTSLAAHIVVPAEFREIVNESALIARGVVTDVRAVAVPGRGIDTIATVAVESLVKGDEVRFVSVRLPGGQIGSTRFVMLGAPTLRVGERAVFLLKRDPENFWRPVGLSMGIFRVRIDPRTGRGLVDPPVVPNRTASATGPVVRGDTRRQTMAVDEFEGLVRTMTLGRAMRRGGRQ
ncbi:MAG: hypothetical protein R2752_12595 [Vicinamibacterales bacterium]